MSSNEDDKVIRDNVRKEGMDAWKNKRYDAINPYNINTLKAELWFSGFQNAMHKEYYNA